MYFLKRLDLAGLPAEIILESEWREVFSFQIYFERYHIFYVGGKRRNLKDEIYCLYSSTSKVSPCLLSLCCEEVLWRMKKQWGQFCFTLETLSAGLEGQKKRWDRACRLFPGYFHSLGVLKTSLELWMLYRSLSDSQSLTLNVITFSQMVRNCELCICGTV